MLDFRKVEAEAAILEPLPHHWWGEWEKWEEWGEWGELGEWGEWEE